MSLLISIYYHGKLKVACQFINLSRKPYATKTFSIEDEYPQNTKLLLKRLAMYTLKLDTNLS